MAMTEEVKRTIQTVYQRQLQGIMLHFDMSLIYRLFRMNRPARFHYKQAIEETKLHAKTCRKLVDKTESIIRVTGPVTRPALPDITERPMSKLERESISRNLIKLWADWEKETASAYQSAAAAMPDCDMWEKLADKAEKEMELAEKLLE